MKKAHVYLAICVGLGSIVSPIILHVFFSVSWCTLLEEALKASFTGCLFAVPSGMLVVIEKRRDEKKRLFRCLSQLCDLAESCKCIGINGDYTAAHQDVISQYYELCLVLQSNYSFSTRDISSIIHCMFDVAQYMEEIAECRDEARQEKYKQILETLDSCKTKAHELRSRL